MIRFHIGAALAAALIAGAAMVPGCNSPHDPKSTISASTWYSYDPLGTADSDLLILSVSDDASRWSVEGGQDENASGSIEVTDDGKITFFAKDGSSVSATVDEESIAFPRGGIHPDRSDVFDSMSFWKDSEEAEEQRTALADEILAEAESSIAGDYSATRYGSRFSVTDYPGPVAKMRMGKGSYSFEPCGQYDGYARVDVSEHFPFRTQGGYEIQRSSIVTDPEFASKTLIFDVIFDGEATVKVSVGDRVILNSEDGYVLAIDREG